MELIAENGQIKIDEIHFGEYTKLPLSQQFHKIFCIEMNFAVEVDVKVSIELILEHLMNAIWKPTV